MKPLDAAALASRPEFDVRLTENVSVPMRDGVRMATDVYRPARAGRPLEDLRPVLLHRTPYNKVETEATSGQCGYFAARGYVAVNQDCRGCFGSEGDVNFLIPEAEDGADTIAWIRKQEWCDGTVGAFGTSWSGWTQTAMAALSPEGLATMVPNMSGADGHESSVRHGGALERRFLAWAFWHSAYNTQAALTAPPHVQAALNQGAPGRERGELVKASEPVQVTLTLYPTSNLFMPGHRIRLDVSSSNFPRFDVNPNTGEAIGRERRRVVADNTVFHERGRESRVLLPIVPIEPGQGGS